MRLPTAARQQQRLRSAGGRVVGSLRLRRRFASGAGPFKLELGSGPVRREGWLATDVGGRGRYHLDVTRPWPLPSGSLTHVYADNVIEHVPLDGGRLLLREAMRTLRPGGRIRLVTPDAERCAQVYLEGGERAEAQLDAHRGAGTHVEHRVDILRGVFIEYEHYRGYAWDLEALRAELEAAGFTSIERCELEQSSDPALRNLESRVLPIDRVTMLAVEAVRP